MIEIRKKENSKRDTEHQLFIDGALVNKVSVYAKRDSPTEYVYAEIATRDKETSKQLALYSLSEYPPIANLRLSYYLDDLKYLNHDDEIYIDREYGEDDFTGQYSLRLSFGGHALSAWRETYSFKEYAWKMFKAFKEIENLVEVNIIDANDRYINKEHRIDRDKPYFVDLSFDKIDKNRIHSLDLDFPYSSAKTKIADELARISKIVLDAHEETVKSLTSSTNDSRIEIRKDQSDRYQLFINNVLLEQVHVEGSGMRTDDEATISISTKDYQTSLQIASYRFYELPPINHMWLMYKVDWSEIVNNEIFFLKKSSNEPFTVSFTFGDTVLPKWKGSYDFSEYALEFVRRIEAAKDTKIEIEWLGQQSSQIEVDEDVPLISGFTVMLSIPNPQLPLIINIDRCSNILHGFHEEVIRSLASRVFESKVKIRKSGNANNDREHQLFINDILLDKASVYASKGDSSKLYFNITAHDKETSRQIASHRLSEFQPLERLSLSCYLDGLKYIDPSGGISISEEYKNGNFTGRFKISLAFGVYALPQWHEPYGFADYAVEMFKAFEVADASVEKELIDREFHILNKETRHDQQEPYKVDVSLDQIDKSDIYGLILIFPYSSPQVKIADELKLIARIYNEVQRDVVNLLISRNPSNSVAVSFDFPQEVRVPCEQYLLYFTEFLRDLGVKANSDLKHEAGQVLFTVTPNERLDALDKIRIALEVYLKLPSTPMGNFEEKDIAIQRLAANINHLKGQLYLSQALIQTKDAEIQAKRTTITNQQFLLGIEDILESLKDITPKLQDEEELLESIRSLVEYKVEANVTEKYRWLRRLFTNKE